MEDIQCYYLHAEKQSVRFLNQASSLVILLFVVTLTLPDSKLSNCLGEDSLITLQTWWMVALRAWDQDHSHYWTVVQKDKSENVYVMAKSGVSNASHSPGQPDLSKQLICSASTHLIKLHRVLH